MHDHDPDRAASRFALAHLSQFVDRMLPGAVLRIARWRKLPPADLGDLRQELHQELVVDCLERGPLLLALPETTRNHRWLRRIEHWVYHHRLTWANRRAQPVLEWLPDPRPTGPATDTADPLAQLPFEFLANGRINLHASRQSTGRNPRRLRRELLGLAAGLGRDAAAADFWRRRAAEAFTGLGADLLRSTTQLPLLDQSTRPPDLERRMRRVRRLLQRVPRGGPLAAVRSRLRRWERRLRVPANCNALDALATAVDFAPGHVAAWLWLAEAHLAAGQFGAAVQALRTARGLPRCPRSSQVLTRARILQARHRSTAALRLVARAAARWPGNGRLRAAIQQIGTDIIDASRA